ncbi:MAG: glycosyltransferase [Acidimicrobiales bacterium]
MHQFTAVLADRDAVGAHTLELHRLLGELGAEARIYAGHVEEGLRGVGRDFRVHDDHAPPDLVIYQASTGTPVADHVLGRPEPLVVDYHNITPSEHFEPWEPAIAAELDHGRRQLARLARRAVLGLADSRFNAAELEAAGCADTRVAPILFDRSRWASPVPRVVVDRLRRELGDRPVWLFVGRVAPNKAHHDLVSALAVHRSRTAARTRLVLVGGASSDRYRRAVVEHASRAGVGDSVVFAGSVGDDELAAWYEVADVFVCLSDHEGFCVPLLEAMARGLPIVAHAATAVPETLAGAGLVLADKAPTTVSCAVERVTSDRRLRESLISRGRSRLRDFDLDRTTAVFRDALVPLLERVTRAVRAGGTA